MTLFDRNLEAWFYEACEDGNPYLTEWFAAAALSRRVSALFNVSREEWEAAYRKSLEDGTHEYAARPQLVGKYAWAIPCRAALDVLAKHAPLVEMGAGTGYWTWLLRKRGVDVAAFDQDPPPSGANHWHAGSESWTKIEIGGPSALACFAGHTLFLCWPPYADPMAAECLKLYRGNRLVFVGEGQGGCTGDHTFWSLLNDGWEQIEEVTIPQFNGLHDYMQVFARKV